MSLPSMLEPLLKKYDLLALLTNEGWLLIRRKCYIDIYIKDEPYSSVEVLYHTLSKRIIVRLWGRTIHNQPGDIAQEVEKAFSNKPCFGICIQNQSIDIDNIDNLLEKEYPTPRYISTACNTWSEETYEKNGNLNPATCQSCKNNLIKHEETTCEEGIETAGIKHVRYNDSNEDNEFKTNTQLCPPDNEVDIPHFSLSTKILLAKLYQESNISKCKSNQDKRDMWKKIAEEYSKQRNIPLIHHKKLARKWWRMVTVARMKRSNATKFARAIGEGAPPATLDQESELVLLAAEAHDDLPSTSDSEQDLEPNWDDMKVEDNALHEVAEGRGDSESYQPQSHPHFSLSTKRLLAKLYQESNISKCKSNQDRRDKWKKITEEYCKQKNISLIGHKKLARKWSRMVCAAQKKRSNATKAARANGEGAPYAALDQESELVLLAAEANAELPYTSDSEADPEPNWDDMEVEDNALHEMEESRGDSESCQPHPQPLHDLQAIPQRIDISNEDLKASTLDTKEHPDKLDCTDEMPFGSGSGAHMIKKETGMWNQDYFNDNSHDDDDNEIKRSTQLNPPDAEVDHIPHYSGLTAGRPRLPPCPLLAKLYRDSNILSCKTTQDKRDKWKKIAEEYCKQKNIPLIHHLKLSRKWSRMVTSAQIKRSDAKFWTPYAKLDQDTELVLSAAEANADLPSTTDYVRHSNDSNEDNEFKTNTQLCPPDNKVDDVPHFSSSTKILLAKLYQESNISKCKSNQDKRDMWKKIAEEYCKQKNIPLIHHKKLSRKWSRIVAVAQKKRSNAEKFASATGGDAPYATLDQETELVLSAAEADADLPSTTDWDYIEAQDKHIKEELLLDMERELKEVIKMEDNCVPVTKQSDDASSLTHKDRERAGPTADDLGGGSNKEKVKCDGVESRNESLSANNPELKDNGHGKICELRKCPYCDKTFTKNSVYFPTHLKRVHFSGAFKCQVCGFTAKFAQDLVQHMNENCKNHDPLTKCPNCRQKIVFEEIEGHYKECVGKSHQEFKKKTVESTKFRKNQTVCPLCAKNVTVGSLPSHLKIHKREQRLKEGESRSSLDSFCEKCGMKFINPRSLWWHMKNMHSEKPIPCPDCDLEFATIGQMTYHQAKHHKPKLQCQHCDYKAHNKQALNYHTAKHFDPTFKCNQCGNMYPTQGSLRWHVKLKHEGYVAKGTKA